MSEGCGLSGGDVLVLAFFVCGCFRRCVANTDCVGSDVVSGQTQCWKEFGQCVPD